MQVFNDKLKPLICHEGKKKVVPRYKIGWPSPMKDLVGAPFNILLANWEPWRLEWTSWKGLCNSAAILDKKRRKKKIATCCLLLKLPIYPLN